METRLTVANGALMEVKGICSQNDSLYHIIQNPEGSTEGWADATSTLGCCDGHQYQYNSRQEYELPELVSPKTCGFPFATAAEISAAYGLT